MIRSNACAEPEIVIKGTSGQIADRLRSDIEGGLLTPGARLNQVDLAARFGLSRIPVREALRQLEAEGYVNYRPNKGVTVITALPIPDLLEVIEIRQCLESRLMQHAVKGFSENTLKRAQDALDRMNGARATADLRGTHEHFHTVLFDAAQRPRMTAMINEWRFRFDDRSDRDGKRLRGFVRSTRDVHKRLLAGFARRDVAAVQQCVDDEYAIIRSSFAG